MQLLRPLLAHALLGSVAIVLGVLGVTVSPAAATTTTATNPAATAVTGTVLTPSTDRPTSASRAASRARALHARVLRIAASKRGAPYRYGATGPSAFDCSGYTGWVYRKAGRHLPRSSSAQAGAVRHVSRHSARPGDLVFFTSGGHVYHVAIYAGHNSVWHAPRPGERVRRERIWTGSVFFGRTR